MTKALLRLARSTALFLVLPLAGSAPALAQTPVQKVQLVSAATLSSLTWHLLTTDPQGDALHPKLPDAKEFSYALDPKGATLWFKVSSFEPLPERFFGMNVAIDDDGNQDNGSTWWGTNKFKLDRLASSYLFRGDGYWQGVAGVADSEHAQKYLFTGLSHDIQTAIDHEQRAIFLGVPRSALGSATTIRVIATVGSMLTNNDDVPNEGAVVVKLTP